MVFHDFCEYYVVNVSTVSNFRNQEVVEAPSDGTQAPEKRAAVEVAYMHSCALLHSFNCSARKKKFVSFVTSKFCRCLHLRLPKNPNALRTRTVLFLPVCDEKKMSCFTGNFPDGLTPPTKGLNLTASFGLE